ncbi:hypothetical protein [Oceanidesulfovibrio marinus]|uniref:Portal protein n=1 Tax=Oceanidesulfovibrio marinus TaxID=370038 RepID=A0A6P1ZEV9_9BACT|nr:hypothetical protein [Oceanidesulfovibrio marinus]TVM31169.1 hypothetical protein DQK91_18845 [Oceanidesulfovibrio marinus]
MSIASFDAVNAPELLPPEGHGRVAYRIVELVEQCLADKADRGLPQKWKDAYRLKVNKAFIHRSTARPQVGVNLLHRHRVRTVNTLTDNQPSFDLAPAAPVPEDMQDPLTSLHRLTRYWWQETEQQSSFERAVDRGETYGIAIKKVVFDPDAESGLGEVLTVNIDPFRFGVYPTNCEDVQKAEAVFHFYPMSVREARRRWPENAKKIKPDREVLEQLEDYRRDVHTHGSKESDRGMLRSFIGWVNGIFGSGTNRGQGDETLVIEAWVRDYTYDEETDRMKYPGAIRRVLVCSGSVVLEDRPNPNIHPGLPWDKAIHTYLFDKFPFIAVPSYEDEGSIWGMSDFDQLAVLQKEFSKTMSQAVHYKDRAVRAKIVNPQTSGVANEEFTNDIGIINPANSMEAAAIRVLDTPGLPFDIPEFISLIRELFFLVAGTFEIEQANTGGRDVIAAKALAELLEQAATMLRGKLRNYMRLVREMGRMYLSHAQNFYTEERFISFRDENGEVQTFTVRGSDLITPIKLTVVNGSTLPKSKVAMREEAMELFDKGVIDRAAVLEIIDFPDRAEILRRMELGGMMLDRLAALGMGEQDLSVVQRVADMDDKEFERELKSDDPPQLVGPDGNQQAERDNSMRIQSAEASLKEAEVELKHVESQLVAANHALTMERGKTEQYRQQKLAQEIALFPEVTKAEIQQREARAEKKEAKAAAAEKAPDKNPDSKSAKGRS